MTDEKSRWDETGLSQEQKKALREEWEQTPTGRNDRLEHLAEVGIERAEGSHETADEWEKNYEDWKEGKDVNW